jgi:hypothetical protein
MVKRKVGKAVEEGWFFLEGVDRNNLIAILEEIKANGSHAETLYAWWLGENAMVKGLIETLKNLEKMQV